MAIMPKHGSDLILLRAAQIVAANRVHAACNGSADRAQHKTENLSLKTARKGNKQGEIMNKITKQCVAAIASLAMAGTLCVAGAVVAGSSAWADDGTVCDTSKAPWAKDQIANCVGSIEITNYEASEYLVDTLLPGAKFKVQRVTKLSTSDTTSTDLKDYKNWEALATKVKSLNDNPNPTGMEFDSNATQEGTTGSTKPNKGVVKFNNLPFGLYKVEETEAAPGHSNDVTPFYMTIPEIIHEANNKVNYRYNVFVFPKNQSLAGKITKTLVHGDNETSFVGKSDTMTYKISAAITSNTATERSNWTKDDLKGYTVFDQAPDYAFTSFSEDNVKSVNLVYTNSNKVKTTTQLTGKYSVSLEEIRDATGTKVVAHRVKVSFDGANGGLNDIANAAKVDPDAKVEIEFAFAIHDPMDVSETSFTNKSGFIQGQGKNKPAPTPEVSDDKGSTVTSNYGYLQVNKYDGTFKSTDKNTDSVKPKLAGAKFKLFAKKADADKCAADTSADECKNASKVGELTTNENGMFEKPVKVVIDSADHPFYIVETEAPANYERDHQAHEATVLTTSTVSSPTSVDIANLPTKDNGSWFKLPKSGAAGVIIFALAGVCLVCFGIFVFMRNRKKDEEQAA